MGIIDGATLTVLVDRNQVKIIEGDTPTVLVDRKQYEVRLFVVVAPEDKQAFGTRSRRSLGEMCAGKTATIQHAARHEHGYIVGMGSVICGGVDTTAEQVRRGMVWVFELYAPKDSPLFAIQEEAKVSRRGLWADPNPVPPWEFRRKR